MENLFEKHTVEARMLDFSEGFTEKAIPVEIRKDCFTGTVSAFSNPGCDSRKHLMNRK